MINPRIIEAFEADDLAFVRAKMPKGTDPKVVEMTFHKARLATILVSKSQRIASANWLTQRGLTDMAGNDPQNAIGQ